MNAKNIPPEERANYVKKLIHRDEWKLICLMREAETCKRKITFIRETDAMADCIRLGSRIENPILMRPYKCPTCNKWHLTSKKLLKKPRP